MNMEMLPFEQIIIRGMNRLLLPRGYHRKCMNWYNYFGHTTVIFACRYHKQFAVMTLGKINRADFPETHPSIHDSYYSKGMRWLVEDQSKWLAARNHEHWKSIEDANPLFELVREFGLPTLDRFENDAKT